MFSTWKKSQQRKTDIPNATGIAGSEEKNKNSAEKYRIYEICSRWRIQNKMNNSETLIL